MSVPMSKSPPNDVLLSGSEIRSYSSSVRWTGRSRVFLQGNLIDNGATGTVPAGTHTYSSTYSNLPTPTLLDEFIDLLDVPLQVLNIC